MTTPIQTTPVPNTTVPVPVAPLPTVDVDGMPLADPAIAKDANGAWLVFGPAMNQANSFHAPTVHEKDLTLQLLNNFKISTINGISTETTKQIMSAADGLGLHVCRMKQTKHVNGIDVQDSVLVLYTKPGVHNYSGAFMMLRETKHSKVIILSPHDDSDGTYGDTKVAMANSYALALFSDGHKRGKVSHDHTEYRASDIVHSNGANGNLGTFAVSEFCKMFPASVFLHIHGMSNAHQCMFNSRNAEMSKIFKSVLMSHTGLKNANQFIGLPVSFSVDTLVNTNNYLKTEMPALIHENNHSVMTLIVTEMEKAVWCWQPLAADAASSGAVVTLTSDIADDGAPNVSDD